MHAEAKQEKKSKKKAADSPNRVLSPKANTPLKASATDIMTIKKPRGLFLDRPRANDDGLRHEISFQG